jgi:phosphatidylglycerophosphate synthase
MIETTPERFWTIPNILSLYRILMFPVLLYFLWQGNRPLFVLLLAINLITDILDGYIARRFNMQTAIGARLDSWADVGSYVLAYLGIVQFEWPFLVEHKWGLSLFGVLFLLSLGTAVIRFGGVIGVHLYSIKITGYLQGAFLMWLLWRGNAEWFYRLMIGFGCLAKIEEIAVLLLLRMPRSNVKGLYWVLQNR